MKTYHKPAIKIKLISHILLFLIVFISLSGLAQAQDTDQKHDDEGEDGRIEVDGHAGANYLRMAIFIGHTFVALDDSGEKSPIPSWGFDIEYWITHKFAVGFHNDVEILNYVIETSDHQEDIEREFPVVFTADVLYRPWKDLVVFGGIGKEFEKNQDYWVYRFGIEYEILFAHYWDICPSIFYDSRKGAFNTTSIMLGVGRLF